jgi:tetratricopeptide (TPR) repeat protein
VGRGRFSESEQTVRFFKRVFRDREWERRRRDVFESPSPQRIHSLAEHVAATGDVAEAVSILDEGLRVYPGSERLQELVRSLRRRRKRPEIEGLLAAEKKSPAPEIFGRLAEIYRSLADDDAALEVCRRCMEKFPDDENPYLVTGKIRLARFYRNLTTRDGEVAAENLERVVALNPQNLKARVLLAEFYAAVGHGVAALPHLQAILSAGPPDERFAILVDEIASRGKPVGERSFTLTDRLREVALSGRLPYVPRSGLETFDRPASGSIASGSDVESDFAEEIRQAGATRGSLLFDWPHPAAGADPFARMVSEVLTAAQSSLREMDLGDVCHATFTGDFGHIVVARVGSGAAAAQCSSSGPVEDVTSRMQDFLAKHTPRAAAAVAGADAGAASTWNSPKDGSRHG